MPSTINASNSGFGGIVSTGDSSGELQLQAASTTAVTINTSGNVGIGTTAPNTFPGKLAVIGDGIITDYDMISRVSSVNANVDRGFKQITDGSGEFSIYSPNGGGCVFGIGSSYTERMRIDSSGNVGINNSNPAQFDTSGEVLNISGAAANTNPAVLFMSGNGGGAGYEATEVFAIAGITAATEITRNTGTGANGFRAYLKVTVTGHVGGIGNGINIKEFYWDGGTSAPVQISTYTNGAVPVISFDNSTNNVWIVRLASSNGTSSFNGVMKVEWLMPIDFASSTWTIS